MNFNFLVGIVVLCFITVWISIMVHELGHLLVLKWLGYNSHISHTLTGYEVMMPREISFSDYKKVLLGGILLGLLPYILLGLLFPLTFLMVPFYLLGARYDIKQLWKR